MVTIRKRWTIPYIDCDYSFWEKIDEQFGDYINEVYLPMPDVDTGTGMPGQSDKFVQTFFSKWDKGISLLINPLILRQPVEKVENIIIRTLKKLTSQYKITSLTLTNITLAKSIKEIFPNLTLVGSVLLDISSVNQLPYLENTFDVLVPSSRILRDKMAIEKLKKSFNGKLRIMVNEGCIPGCLLRTQHFYEMNEKNIAFPKSLCNDILKNKPWLRLTGAWVLPQHLKYFDKLADEYKLAGRITLQNPKKYLEVFSKYIKREELFPNEIGSGPASITFSMKIEDKFYRQTLMCNKDCHNCNVCSTYWEKHINE